MNVLIVFATTEGQTRKIAERCASQIEKHGHGAVVCDSASVARDTNIAHFDLVVIAASVHQETHQESIVDFAIANCDKLHARHTAFVSVSLSAVLEHGRDDAKRYVERFIKTTNWRADNTLLIGGALRFGEYDYFKQQIVKHIVIKRGGPVIGNDDCEFTDWAELKAFIDTALERARTAKPVS